MSRCIYNLYNEENKYNLFLISDMVSIFIVSYCEDIWDLYYKAEFEGIHGLLYISITGYVYN